MKANNRNLYCPYCGRNAVLRNADYVYGEKAYVSHLYVCSGYPECNSFVGVHKNSLTPLGNLADANLRRKRREAHRIFDRLWKQGIFSKGQAYKWIQDKFCFTATYAHIGSFDEYMCDRLISESKNVLQNYAIRKGGRL